MANQTQTIRIESIWGGEARYRAYVAGDQYLTGQGVDPKRGENDEATNNYYGVSGRYGIIHPLGFESFGTSADTVRWIESNPKLENLYAYDVDGSVYSITFPTQNALPTLTGLGDLNDGGTASANGCAYYDNYIYFARDTTIARYGPLNGTPSFTDDYWSNTLSLTPLTDPDYPDIGSSGNLVPNHPMFRHTDGKLYIADVSNNQGVIHYIATSKTTVEGDTNNGSTYQKLTLGYGLYPTAMTSYGDYLVIALYEGVSFQSGENNSRIKPAKLAFWDTTSDKVNYYAWEKISEPIITGMTNHNGVLYIFAGNPSELGYRIYKYIGGESFSEMYFTTSGTAPLQGDIDSDSGRIFFGGLCLDVDQEPPAIRQLFGSGAIKLSGRMNTGSTQEYTWSSYNRYPITASTTFYAFRTDVAGTTGSPYITFGPFLIGQPFKIKKIRFAFTRVVSSGDSLTIRYAVDGDDINSVSTSGTLLGTISSTNWSGKRSVIFRPNGLTGNNSFCLKIRWGTNSNLIPIVPPIIIEYELIDD